MIPTHQTFYYLPRDHVEGKKFASLASKGKKAALQRKAEKNGKR